MDCTPKLSSVEDRRTALQRCIAVADRKRGTTKFVASNSKCCCLHIAYVELLYASLYILQPNDEANVRPVILGHCRLVALAAMEVMAVAVTVVAGINVECLDQDILLGLKYLLTS